ncbi:MAG: rhomboid family intramembrane serine protease [Paracoccus sp. (in: a-proteobacteria)]|uniref:rhomboid family intramembrane serine protease n=1 Tax=Paracoccus sp. TaxID=267 RepID=UPI0026E05C03|nr:rhomboid family intramembrane serine protease [Paracoccus sp. (in: a-proteobacteria)]MDO5631193.1 rhomboid family intramembrane serine protease [Paracoccus sp. (in: a-proteobacteria)]
MKTIPRPFIAIIALCCLIEAALSLAPLLGAPVGVRQLVFALGGFWPAIVGTGRGVYPFQDLAMFISYGFLHAGLAHLAMNMLSLAVLVREMAPALSTARLLAIYAVAQVAGALLFWQMHPIGGPMVGASGAVFGLAGALFGFAVMRYRARGLPMGGLMRSAAILIGLNLILTLLMPSVAWQAHLGGALAGLIMGAVYGAMPTRQSGSRA